MVIKRKLRLITLDVVIFKGDALVTFYLNIIIN